MFNKQGRQWKIEKYLLLQVEVIEEQKEVYKQDHRHYHPSGIAP